MEQLKLQVGKTYRSRKGEEVKIVKHDGGSPWPYCGSSGKGYAADGKWASRESSNDLIAEVPETRHTFAIPDGVKELTLDYFGNRIVVEMVPEKEPKPGDVMVNDLGSVYIFKGVARTDTHKYYAWLGKTGRLAKTVQLSMCGLCISGRSATPEEAKPLFDALKKAGKRWNPETMKVGDVPERIRIMSFLQGYANNVTWNYEQLCWLIEDYLKYKEGEQCTNTSI